MALRTIGVKLRWDNSDYNRGAGEAVAGADRVSGKLKQTGQSGKADLDKLAHAATLVGVALVAAAGVAITSAAAFDKQMSEVGAVANATGDQLEDLRKAAIAAGAATVFSAKDAAEAEAELAKAGVSTSDILSGALTGSLNLASAGSLDLAESATIAANAMNTFGLKGSDVGHVADVLSAAANKSAASVGDLGLGLQQVGLVANQVGLSFEETVGLLAAFADRGLRGSDGATSLKTALQRLAAPTDAAAATMKELGLSMYDSTGNMIDAVGIAGQLQTSLKDLSPAQRNAALQTIFGSDAIRAANVLYDEGADGIRDYINAVDDQGAASRVAAAKLDNLSGDIEQLKGSLETLFIQSGEGASGGLRLLAKGATDLVNAFGSLPGPVQTGAVVLAGLAGVALLTTAAALKLKKGFGDLLENLDKLGPSGARAGRGLQNVVTLAGRAGLVFAGLAIASAAVDAAISDLNPQIEALSKGLSNWAETGDASGEATRLLGDDMDKLDLALRNATSGGKGFATWVESILPGAKDADSSWTKNIQRIQALDSALAQLVQSGKGDDAAAVFAKIKGEAVDLNISVEDLKNAFPEYGAALEVAGQKAQEQAAAAKQAKEENIKLAGAFGEAASEADGLKTAFDGLNGTELKWRDAQRKAEAAVDDLTTALQESNGSLDVHEEKGRAASAAVDALATSAAEAAQKKFDETQSVEDANAVYQDYIGTLRQTLLNAGYAKDYVDKLVGSIAAMPSYKAVTIDVTQVLHTDDRREEHALYRRWGGVTEHAATGLLKSAAVYAPVAPARYAFAEPQTGGEAFVPRRGDYGRSMKILSAAAGWYNADVVPRGGWYGMQAGGEGGGTDVTITPLAGADNRIMRAITQSLRVDVRTKGRGSPQNYLSGGR